MDCGGEGQDGPGCVFPGYRRDGSRGLRRSALVRSRDHGVDGVDDDCDDHPEDRRQEEAASDIHDVMGVEETVCIFLAGGSVGEACVSCVYV